MLKIQVEPYNKNAAHRRRRLQTRGRTGQSLFSRASCGLPHKIEAERVIAVQGGALIGDPSRHLHAVLPWFHLACSDCTILVQPTAITGSSGESK